MVKVVRDFDAAETVDMLDLTGCCYSYASVIIDDIDDDFDA